MLRLFSREAIALCRRYAAVAAIDAAALQMRLDAMPPPYDILMLISPLRHDYFSLLITLRQMPAHVTRHASAMMPDTTLITPRLMIDFHYAAMLIRYFATPPLLRLRA